VTLQTWWNIGWLVLLVLLFGYFFSQYWQLRALRRWRKVEGHVTHFSLQEQDGRLWPDIEYSYSVDSKTYHNDHFFSDNAQHALYSRYARKLAHRIALAYKNDEDIWVYYDPKDPEQAVLDRRIPPKLFGIIAVVLFFLGVELWMFLR